MKNNVNNLIQHSIMIRKKIIINNIDIIDNINDDNNYFNILVYDKIFCITSVPTFTSDVINLELMHKDKHQLLGIFENLDELLLYLLHNYS
jgi:hypothetical protein